MSASEPVVYPPFPIVTIDESAPPYETAPVEPVEAAAPARAVEGEEDRSPAETLSGADAVAISATARTVAEAAKERSDVNVSLQATGEAFDPVEEAGNIRDNRGMRELLAGFADYDNSAAQARYADAFSVSATYGGAPAAADEGDGVAELRARENQVYYELGFFPAGDPDRAERGEMEKAIDEWLAGTGVFVPSMLGYPSSDGFRFAPLTEEARASLRAADVLSSYDRARIASYLREMAGLTPNDFMFYDPTGLGALPLDARREFLARVERLLEEAGAERRAAELRYSFDLQNRLELNRMDIDDEAERRRIEALEPQISGYYGALAQSLRQYSPGIISAALA